jgi:hypothetical protein
MSDQQARQVVQDAIVESGGFSGEHGLEESLYDAGLKSSGQRGQFQRNVSAEAEDIGFSVDEARVPNGPSTKVREVRRFLTSGEDDHSENG